MLMEWQGDRKLFDGYKIAFHCSRRCPASVVLKAYDWAKMMRNEGKCVISGNHSQIEKDVVHYLLKGNQPIILVLARGLKKRVEPELAEAIARARLLIITPFRSSIVRVTQETANERNDFMAEISDELFVAYAQPNGNVYQLMIKWLKKGKKVSTFDVPESSALMEAGAARV